MRSLLTTVSITLCLVLATLGAAKAADAAPAATAVEGEARALAGLDGTWALDRAASDPLDALLEAEGVPYVERKVIDGLAVTQVITRAGDVLTIDLHTTLKTVRQTLSVDGVERVQAREDGGGTIELHHSWDDCALVTTARGSNREGEPFEMTTRRTVVDDGRTLVQVTELVRFDGTRIVVRRVYRRVVEEGR